ncbi:MAG TPA: HepT-like ribonuclease domain-containing protein [Vicinamibacterales bacterium]
MDAIEHIQQFVEGMDFEAFRGDSRTVAAVERKLLTISEAAIRLKDDATTLCPDVPWPEIRGIGNWLRHQYDRIDLETLWNTVRDDLPPLLASARRALGSLAIDDPPQEF